MVSKTHDTSPYIRGVSCVIFGNLYKLTPSMRAFKISTRSYKMTKTFEQKIIEQKETIESVTNAIKNILNMKNVTEKHKKKLLSLMLWFLTEADGLTATKRTNHKHKLIYISQGTYNKLRKIGENKPEYIKDLVHEHIYTRNSLVQKLLETPEQLNLIIENAIACVVTKEEDKRLREVDKTKTCDGWERYKKAKIGVYKRIREKDKNDRFEPYMP